MYRKRSATQIFNGFEFIRPDSVLITDENDTILDIVTREEAGDGIEFIDGILSPGFVNCHCHLELSHMKGMIPKSTGLVDFLMNIVKDRHATDEFIQASIASAEQEMIDNGIVAVGDICNTNHTIAQKQKSNIHYHNFIEVSGFPKELADDRFEKIKLIYNEFAHFNKHNSIVPHAPYSVSTDLLKKIVDFPGNDIIAMHNQETAAEDEFFKEKKGAFLDLYNQLGIPTNSFISEQKSSLQHFLPYFKKSASLMLVHNVHTNEADIDVALSTFDAANLYMCLCPAANLYISNQLPDVDLLLRKGLNIVLGTDSLASNERLSIHEEIKIIRHNYPAIPLSELLKWATSNGAKALKIDDQFGSFEKGKRPGFVVVPEFKV